MSWCGNGPSAIQQWDGLLNGRSSRFWCGPTTSSLVTSSASEAKRRTQEVGNVCKKKKLFFNQSSLEILPSGAAEKDNTPSRWRRRNFVGCAPCWCLAVSSTARAPLSRISEVVCFRGGRCSTSSDRCCAAHKFRRKNVSVRSTPQSGLALVGLWLLDPIGGCATVSVSPEKQVAPLRPGWKEEKSDLEWVEWVRLILCGASWTFRLCGTGRWRRSSVGRDTWPEKTDGGRS